MIYFLWAFLFSALGVSVAVTSFRSSYRPILKFVFGILLFVIGLWCVAKIDIPMKYNYGKKVVQYGQNIVQSLMSKIRKYF